MIRRSRPHISIFLHSRPEGNIKILFCGYWLFVPLSDDVLELAGLPGRLGEEQDPRGEAVQAVHRVQRLQPVLLNNIRVADLHHFHADQDPASHFDADSGLSFQFNADPDTGTAPQQTDENLLRCYHWSTGLHFEPLDFQVSISSTALFSASKASEF